MPHRDALVAANARIEALESQLDELQPSDEAEADRLTALQEEVERLRDALDESEANADALGGELQALESELEAFGLPRDVAAQVAASQAEAKAERPRARANAPRPWHRKNPKAFGLAVLGAWVVVALAVLGVASIGVEGRGLGLQAFAHLVGVVFGARLVYTGASRWADPSLGVVMTQYAHGRAADGTNVSVATGSKEVKVGGRKAVMWAAVGIVIWLAVAGFGSALIHGLLR